MGEPIRVVVADDQALVRDGLVEILDAEPDITVVGEAGDGHAAVAAAGSLSPDVVLMDVRMPGLDGIAATAAICAGTSVRVLMLTTYDVDEHVYAALRAGASGFLLKSMRGRDLADAVRVVAAGEALLAPSVTRRLIADLAARPAPAPSQRIAGLSPRETDTLRALARGLSNAEIAAELYVTEHTVKTHVSNLLAKLGLRDRVQAVVLAYESGLVTARPQE
ncbi:response regulator [Virgisporangium ochraceum]|uniref:DNA-binding response regulator n=1 Tax=Virgisporangium ochraceum TaxID=65505 RepID=A0A8J3ZXS9_9ACTN|nr:response regulator transcription factor [Virgisporangium ochraceum]GIJ71596.1 DNA-binding response regulator [Virgisporangium ochraceum]